MTRLPLGARWQKPVFLFARLMVALSCLCALTGTAAAQDVVIYSSDVSTIQGNWARVSSASGAGTSKLTSGDWGWATLDAPLAVPGDYFEATFSAQAWTQYRVWLRLRAAGDSKWNDSVWVQFSDSHDAGGNAVYRIGTASGLLVNLESCQGCGVGAWGWSGGAWWVDQATTVQFATSGSKTVRVQTREDGVEVDQIVLSASTYRHSAPGSSSYDSTILSKNTGDAGSSGGGSASVRSIVGTIEAEDFDNGANGTAYWDSTGGNSGGQYRSTDVDIEGCSEGGFNVGWIASGEWLNYTVNVPSSGTYTLEFRVASPGGGALRAHVGGEDKTGSVALPATGGWQSWTTVRKTVSLSAGIQVMRLVFDTGGFNLNYVNVASGGSSSPASSSSSPTPFGGTAWPIPGTIQTEDFDNGGQGVAYHDHTSGNTGGAYRATDVDVAATPNGGHTVGWVGAGEWLRYTVNVTTAGHYTLTARVASAGDGGTFHVEFNGSDVTGAMRVPNTGSWTTYQDVNATVWVDAGVQAMRLVFDSDGPTGAVGNFTFLRLTSGSAPAPAPEPALASAPSSGGGRLRVMTWNIHFGYGDTWGQAQEIADSGADVVLLQEAQTWDEHMPTTYRDRLRQMTGHTWYTVWAGGPECTYGCQGTLILSRFPIVDSSTATFDGTPVGRALVDVGGVRVNVFNVHLEYYDTSKRSSQLLQFMDWMRWFSGPRIAGGDFNSWWGEWWILHMQTEYSDTWRDVTGSTESGYTLNGAVRFDYLFRAYHDNWRLTPTAIRAPWTGRSDHYPVIADYTVQ